MQKAARCYCSQRHGFVFSVGNEAPHKPPNNLLGEAQNPAHQMHVIPSSMFRTPA